MTTVVLLGRAGLAGARQTIVPVSERHTTLFLCSFHLLDAGADQGRTGLLLQFLFRLAAGWGASGSELDKILRKEQIERPVQGHEDFLLKSGQFQQVNRAPQPPGNEA